MLFFLLLLVGIFFIIYIRTLLSNSKPPNPSPPEPSPPNPSPPNPSPPEPSPPEPSPPEPSPSNECPDGTSKNGNLCVYTRVGTIPTKLKPCEDGQRDDGASCWLDTYGVGVGRIPDKKPCPPGLADILGSCWLEEHTYGKGCCCFFGSCCHNCPAGYTDIGCLCRRENTGIKLWPHERYLCNDDEEINGALCYPKCKQGFHKVGCCLCEPEGGPGIRKTVGERQYCDDDEELIGGLCYKNPKPGFECNKILPYNCSKKIK